MPKLPPPVFAVGGLVAQHLLAPRRRPTALRAVVGGVIAAGSVYLAGSAVRAFGREHTTVNPLEPERATTVVADGPFRYTRNPMYLGLAGLLTAHAVLRGGLLTLAPVAAFVAVIDRTQIPAEEQALSTNFGPAYDVYRSTTPRWLGSPRGASSGSGSGG